MKGLILSGTGHRMNKLGGYTIKSVDRLYLYAKNILVAYQPVKLISGMALGWDQALVEAALDLDIPYVAAVPFLGQEYRWPDGAQERYRHLMRLAADVVVVSMGSYSAEKMQVRNEWMVDNSQGVLALWNGTPGGTANCVRYAKKVSKPIFNVWPGWEEVMENAN